MTAPGPLAGSQTPLWATATYQTKQFDTTASPNKIGINGSFVGVLDQIASPAATALVAENASAPMHIVAAAPTGASPTASVVLTWAPISGATLYTITKSTNSTNGTDGTWGAGVPPTSTTATVTETGLSTGSTWFKVAPTVGGTLQAAGPAVRVVV